jgi:hypothetical protein
MRLDGSLGAVPRSIDDCLLNATGAGFKLGNAILLLLIEDNLSMFPAVFLAAYNVKLYNLSSLGFTPYLYVYMSAVSPNLSRV